MIHEIPLERRTLHGHFSRDLPAILTIDPGDAIAFSCPNAGWQLGPDERFEPRDEHLDAGHALVGPIDVRGAQAGGTLLVRIDQVRPGTFGETWGHETGSSGRSTPISAPASTIAVPAFAWRRSWA